jgi:site-specific recombinase XerD
VVKAWLREPQRGSSNVLFPSAKGERLSVHGVQYLLNKHRMTASKVCPSLKHKRVTVHRLRHYAGSRTMPGEAIFAASNHWLM